jgi:hypothetical protein
MAAKGTVWQADWPVDPMEAGRRIDERYSDKNAGGLLVWAAWTVEGMHYLTDVDASLPRPPYAAHNHEAVDLSHTRWATVDAITAIDLCAALLGRMHCGYPSGSPLDTAPAPTGEGRPPPCSHCSPSCPARPRSNSTLAEPRGTDAPRLSKSMPRRAQLALQVSPVAAEASSTLR